MRHRFFILVFFTAYLIQGQDLDQMVGTYVRSYVDTGDFSGCILITEGGDTLYKECFGMADYSFALPNTPQTKFRIGSISKQFTAAAILILEQKGKLKMSDPLSRFFTDYPIAEKISLEQLLTHTSGITDIYNIPNFNSISCQKFKIADIAKLVLETDPEFEPGSRYQYSNGGYAILAEIIERVSGISYEDFLKSAVFDPLGMTNTGHAAGFEIVSNLAKGYDPLGYSGLKITPYLDPEILKGSGSLYSTIEDLQVWIQSVNDRILLESTSYDKLLHNYGYNYGLGISVYTSQDQNVFGHDGRVNGYIADYLHYNETDTSIIILGNIQTGVADFFRSDVAAIVFDKDFSSRAKTALPLSEVGLPPEPYLGTYAFGPNFKVFIEFFDGSIQARANEGGYSELIPLEDGRFFSRTLYSYIDFQRDENGVVTKMRWINNDGNSFEGFKEK